MADDKPIIVIKKKGGHGGHHGGAWKVAYADFVTAMMCFFMVMWLINSAEAPTRQSIASYFRRPGLFDKGSGTPLLMGEAGIIMNGGLQARTKVQLRRGAQSLEPQLETGEREVLGETGTDTTEDQPVVKSNEGKTIGLTNPYPGPKEGELEELRSVKQVQTGPEGPPPVPAEEGKEQLEQLAAQIKQTVAGSPGLSELLGELDVKMDADGLNIEIIDTEKTSMFRLGSAAILPEAQAAFSKIAELIKTVPNEIGIVGHTDAKPFGKRSNYTNWELSADRANAARRLLQEGGIPLERITDVIGRADKELKLPSDPLAAANRRITLKIKYPKQKTIDISKDPKAMERALREKEQQQAARGQRVSAPVRPAKATPQVHTITPKQILKGMKKRRRPGRVPAGEDEAGNGGQRHDIFQNDPVISPFDIFNNLQ